MNFTPTDTLRHIIRARPLAILPLEKVSAHRFWNRLESSLSEFCAEAKLDLAILLGDVSGLPALPENTRWDAKPLYYLIDRLTQDHAGFRDEDLPAITAWLKETQFPPYPDGYVAKLLLQEFECFREEFLKHMEEEELFLFPVILRNEACLRHPQLGPEIYKGSVNLYLKLETHKPDVEMKRMLTSIHEKLRNQLMQEPAAELARKVLAALEAFAARLRAHADLESQVLFPRAGRLEQELYASVLPGHSRFPWE